ncbi:MAG: hypothetical protein WA139_01765 [Candidatus Aenigmatarchaeota archaeon]
MTEHQDMAEQRLVNLKRTVIPNGEKERVRFEIACKSCDSDFLLTGKPHEINMEMTVFNKPGLTECTRFFLTFMK